MPLIHGRNHKDTKTQSHKETAPITILYAPSLCDFVTLCLCVSSPYYTTKLSFCSSAARSVCQASVAHLTRVGNPRRPEKTASLPKLTVSTAPEPVAAS